MGEMSQAAASRNERGLETRARCDRATEELHFTRVAKARSVDARKEAIFSDVAQIAQLRSTTQEHIRRSTAAIRVAIQKQREFSICDGEALRRHVSELVLPLLCLDAP